MPNWRFFLVFLTLTLLIMGGVHFYLFTRLVAETAVPDPWAAALAWLLALAVFSIPLSFLVSRTLDKNLARWFVVPVYVWMGFVFQLFALVLGMDVVRGVGGAVLRLVGVGPLFGDPARALQAWRLAAGTATGFILLSSLGGVWWALSRLVVKRIEISLPRLPAELDRFTILQLSDLHLDLVHGRPWMEQVVERARALEPDLIAITGDLAEGSVAQFADDVQPLRELTAPHGVYFVTGNHEYFHDLDRWLDLLADFGIRVLRNERVPVERNGAAFDLAGVDDHDGSRLASGHGPDLEAALAGRDPDRAVVLLAHQPRIIREAAGLNVDLVLSGHTHGGQIWPFSYLVYLQQPYVKGLKRLDGTQLYLSSGTGFWGPPMRLGTTAEMALVTLRLTEVRG